MNNNQGTLRTLSFIGIELFLIIFLIFSCFGQSQDISIDISKYILIIREQVLIIEPGDGDQDAWNRLLRRLIFSGSSTYIRTYIQVINIL